MVTIKFVDELCEATEQAMSRDLIEYESNNGIDVNYKKFALVLSDNNGVPIGVLNAFTAFAEIYIENMWIEKSNRGKGYGKKLIETLENHFKGKGFNNINLVTSEFNAPGFYKKCGFKCEFIRKDLKNPKLTKHFFVKFFEEKTQTQGILP